MYTLKNILFLVTIRSKERKITRLISKSDKKDKKKRKILVSLFEGTIMYIYECYIQFVYIFIIKIISKISFYNIL